MSDKRWLWLVMARAFACGLIGGSAATVKAGPIWPYGVGCVLVIASFLLELLPRARGTTPPADAEG